LSCYPSTVGSYLWEAMQSLKLEIGYHQSEPAGTRCVASCELAFAMQRRIPH
jgi:hypothetical protein